MERNVLLAALCIFTASPALSQILRNCFLPPQPLAGCSANDRYRSMSGACNNLDNPLWGVAGAQLVRLLPPDYSDGIGAPRGGFNYSSLPNPRWMSQKNHPDNDNPDTRFTHMVMQFGQLLDHDITVTPKEEDIDCCEKRYLNDPRCFPIPIPARDRFYSWVNYTATCLNMVRSTPVCQRPVREHYNGITSFVDASNVYGSSIGQASFLRTYTGGELIVNEVTGQLPTREQLNLRPDLTRVRRPEKQNDFVAGDTRANEHPFLSALHIVFLREHNRIVKELRSYLPQLTDQVLYHETRRLVGAEMQNIVYGEFLPTVLGARYMKKYNLLAEETSKYDRKMNPNIVSAFTSAAFRFGHSMINSMFMLVSGKLAKNGFTSFWRLREIFDGQTVGGARLPLEDMIEGLVSQMPQSTDAFFSTEITNHLFQKNQQRENFGLDLLAINVQRGRDHGLPSYNSYRKLCGLSPLVRWSKKPSEFNRQYWNKLKDVYNSVDDIDLMIGGVAEKNVKGGAVGPTFACIIGEQFKRLKYGDRYFYTHVKDNHGSKGLAPIAKSYILNRTLGDILCENTEIDEIQRWVTLQPDEEYNPQEPCASKAIMDLRAIAEEISSEITRKRRNFAGRSGDGRTPRGPSRLGRNLHPGVTNLLCLDINCQL